jgi:PPM family protein phosphatase
VVLRFSGAGVTDVGKRRDHNEDSGFVGPYVALVADGVGGAAAGEVASATAAYVVVTRMAEQGATDPSPALRDAVSAARELLRSGVDADLQRAGMATTLTAVATDGEKVVLAHLGDSRAYLLRGGLLHQVSHDHTYVQQLVDAGRLDAAGAREHPWRNVVLRSLHGGPAQPLEHPDLVDLDAEVGDRLLLCTDGLTDLVEERRIAEVLELADPQSAAARLVEDALEAGGRDNVTCLVLDVVEGPRVVADGQLLGAVRDLGNVVESARTAAPEDDPRHGIR